MYVDDGYLAYRRPLGAKRKSIRGKSSSYNRTGDARKLRGRRDCSGEWQALPLKAQYSYYLMQRACDELAALAIRPITKKSPNLLPTGPVRSAPALKHSGPLRKNGKVNFEAR